MIYSSCEGNLRHSHYSSAGFLICLYAINSRSNLIHDALHVHEHPPSFSGLDNDFDTHNILGLCSQFSVQRGSVNILSNEDKTGSTNEQHSQTREYSKEKHVNLLPFTITRPAFHG